MRAALIPTVIMGACFMLIPSKGMTVDPLDSVEHHDEETAHGHKHDAEHKDDDHHDHSGHGH